jgi:DNA repair protein RadC
MKELAPYDRPREKLERLGPSALGDNELLAVVLGSGSRARDALTLANALLEEVGGLYGLVRSTLPDLQQIAGIGAARSAQVLAAVELGRRSLLRGISHRPRLNSPREIAAYLTPQYSSSSVEQFGVLLLDTKHRLIRSKIVAVGSLDSSIAHPREVFREATISAASAIVLFHNHPSGDPTPSAADLALTTRMVKAGRILGIDVLDHVILADRRYCSIAQSRMKLTRDKIVTR